MVGLGFEEIEGQREMTGEVSAMQCARNPQVATTQKPTVRKERRLDSLWKGKNQ